MGTYNPHSPYIIGDEWVPIRQADYVADSITERGYTFGIEHAATIVSGAYYTRQPPTDNVFLAAEFLGVYPEGSEDLTGPIKQVTIPVSAIMTTGGSAISDGVAAINNPGIPGGITALGGADSEFGLSFATTSYSQQLFGKRILNVEFIYVAEGNTTVLANTVVGLGRLANPNTTITFASGIEGLAAGVKGTEARSITFTDMNLWWNAAVFSTATPLQTSVYPWRYPELALLDTTGGFTRLIVHIRAFLTGVSGDMIIDYAALRITYCEEKRILYGGDLINIVSTASNNPYPATPGNKFAPLRVPSSLALPGSTAAGRYALTHTWRSIGVVRSESALHTALRELYTLPPQQGLVLNYGTQAIDTEFTKDATHVLPQLSLHTAAAVVTGIHPYGTQNGVPIYGTITAIQEIEDDPAGVSKQYPQVRFYARKFGETTAPLRLIDVATGTFTVQITPAEFDAIPEIVDGWKEINLRFATAPSFATAAGDVDWRWDAVGEIASNQWQVLSANGPSPAAPQALGTATYYAPIGDTVSLTWKAPTISGTADDPLSDATLIFSTDPPAITGFALSTCTQAITGISYECGVPSSCIPTGISGNQISWNNGIICDTYSREVTGGWGTADTGQSWTTTTGGPSEFGVTGGRGRISHSAASTTRAQTVTSPAADVDLRGTVIPPALATGATFRYGLLARFTDTSNFYYGRLTFDTDGSVTLAITEVVLGVATTLGSLILPFTYTGSAIIHVRFRIIGSTLQAKAWLDGEPEPGWEITLTDTSLATVGSVGIRTEVNAGNTNTFPFVFSVDDFQAVPATFADGSYEIQRYDSVDGFWSTILDTTNLCVTGMCDMEARVGVQSIYRMRTKNALEFAGPWVSGAATVPSPGVLGAGSANSVLIFTSNQARLASLAYIMQWEGTPVETFAFPEADTVQLQRMFGKDFFTAFRPLERGGERFQRTLLVSAAAISLESLANFRGLRDLAWADLPYVCVRDELGNRWYATVLVPSGDVRRNRTIYLAQIEVIETTNIPCAIG